MDGAVATGITTRDATIEVAYAVGALVNAVQKLTIAVEALNFSMAAAPNEREPSSATVELALSDVKRTTEITIAGVVQVLRSLGEKPPNER